VHVVAGPSRILRDELVAALLAGWSGPVKRTGEPGDLARIVLDLDTPSLFEEPALWLVRADGRYLRKHAELLLAAVGPATAGVLVLTVPEGERAKAGDPLGKLQKALSGAKAWHEAGPPDAKEVVAWLLQRVTGHPQGVERPRQVAEALVDHLGTDCDALLGALEVAAIHAGDGPLTPEGVHLVVAGSADRPIWEFTNAFLEGNGRKAIELMHAGEGLEAQRALSALAGEVRKLLACGETADDGEVAAWIGARGRPNLYYARQRARNLGRAPLLRLLSGCLLAQRQLRQGGTDQELALETLVLHAQRVVRPGGR
jgi:DNA polymerase III delta subunit